MKSVRLVFVVTFPLVIFAEPAFTQGESAVPFLLLTSSVDGNGMGGISSSLPSVNATAPIANPAQLGIFSLENVFNASIYPEKVKWLPAFSIPNLTYTTTALNAGYNLRDVIGLPFGLSLGIGYSKIDLDLGTFSIKSSSGPTVLGTFESTENSELLSLGIGLDYVVQVGVGMNFKRIESDLGPVGGPGTARVSAKDFGLLVRAPVFDVVRALSGSNLEVVPRVEPLLDLTLGYAHSNEGGEVSYVAAAQSDPLPRKATIGLGLELGFAAKIPASRFKLISFTLGREVEDILIIRHPDGTFEYQSGLGDIRFFDDVVLGQMNDNVTLRKGWQIQAGEFLYVRGGSVRSPGLSYETTGFCIALGGLFKLLELCFPDDSGSWVKFAREHIDVRYDTSKYSDTAGPIDGTSFTQLTLVIKQLPF